MFQIYRQSADEQEIDWLASKTQRKIQGIKITTQPFGVTKSNWYYKIFFPKKLVALSFPYFFGEWLNTFLFFVLREVLWFLLRLDQLGCSTHCTTQPSSEHQVLVLYPCSHFCWNGREIGPKGSLATLLLIEILSLFFTLKSHRTDSGSNPCVNKTSFFLLDRGY